MAQVPNFPSNSVLLIDAENLLPTNRETIQLREARAFVMRLMENLSEDGLGYLAGSEAKEMMDDAWTRLYRDYMIVYEAERRRES